MSTYQDRAKLILEQFRNHELQVAGGRYLNNDPKLTIDQALSELATIVEEEIIGEDEHLTRDDLEYFEGAARDQLRQEQRDQLSNRRDDNG